MDCRINKSWMYLYRTMQCISVAPDPNNLTDYDDRFVSSSTAVTLSRRHCCILQFDLVAASVRVFLSLTHVSGATLMRHYFGFGFGCTSSIHLLGGLFTTVTRARVSPSAIPRSSSLSAYRPLVGRAGHGRMLDAETVTTAARKVKPKSEETN